MINRILTILKKKNGVIDGQRLSAKYFLKHGHDEELEFIQQHSITNTKELRMFITGESDICSNEGCSNERRFVGFTAGFKQYCEKCARTKNNHMLKCGNNGVELSDVPKHVTTKSGYSTTKIKKLSEKTLDSIIKRTEYLNNVSFAERIYHIEHNLYSLPKCLVCGKENNRFYSSKVGYKDACSFECANQLVDYSSKKLSHRKMALEKYKQKYVSDPDYEVNILNPDEYLEGSLLKVMFKHICGQEYVYESDYQGHLKCPKCFPIRSKKQYEIYEWLNQFNVNCIFNDRQLIKPKELDILTETFAIEYDSLMFHSSGKSNWGALDNESHANHISKLISVESKGIQLFRIFSNEWHSKQNIWKSVILSKLNLTNRIYARKTVVRQVSSNEAVLFENDNHLQGSGISSIRLGLEYNGQLVSLMTFGKSRFNKNYEYELIRFCSLINTTVVGGASKLLKYFENTYKPKSLISYANRRWSQGNLYEKLGFEKIRETKPNYFYFKGGDNSVLESRNKYQKHKLSGLLEHFDSSLSETENMFNNGYRKIYDCGNLVFVKQY